MAVTVNDAKNETIENEWMLQENTYLELSPYGQISVYSTLIAQICFSPFSGNFWSIFMFTHGGK